MALPEAPERQASRALARRREPERVKAPKKGDGWHDAKIRLTEIGENGESEDGVGVEVGPK